MAEAAKKKAQCSYNIHSTSAERGLEHTHLMWLSPTEEASEVSFAYTLEAAPAARCPKARFTCTPLPWREFPSEGSGEVAEAPAASARIK